MARGDQLGRQWKIIQSLISARRGKSARLLARELECHPRTVYRDLEALQTAGFPLYSEKRQGKAIWSVLDAIEGRPPLPLNLAEVMALYFSCSLLKQMEHSAFHESLESLFGKIRTMLPAETASYLDRFAKGFHIGFVPHKKNREIGPVIEKLNDAIAGRTAVRMEYYTLSRECMTTREVSPYGISFHKGTVYLIGYCHSRNAVRTFAIDRIRSVEPTASPFSLAEDFDLAAFTQHSFGIFQGPPVKVAIRFSPKAAAYIEEKQWHPSQQVTREKGGSILFEATVAGTQEIRFWILQWGAQARVLHPESLRQDIEQEIRAMQALYTGDPAD